MPAEVRERSSVAQNVVCLPDGQNRGWGTQCKSVLDLRELVCSLGAKVVDLDKQRFVDETFIGHDNCIPLNLCPTDSFDSANLLQLLEQISEVGSYSGGGFSGKLTCFSQCSNSGCLF